MVLHATCLLVVLLCSQLAASVVPSQSHAANNSSTNLARPAVRDIDGQELIPGEKYYVRPRLRVLGGLTIGVRGVDKCPLYLAPAPFELQNGLPMTFTPVNPDDEFVRVSTDLNVHVADVSTVWKLGLADDNRYLVSIDGDEGNPGAETVTNWFKIERNEDYDDYKFVFCPGVCEMCQPVCGDLGLLPDGDSHTLLGLGSDGPLEVHFIPVVRMAGEVRTTRGTLQNI